MVHVESQCCVGAVVRAKKLEGNLGGTGAKLGGIESLVILLGSY